MNYVFLVIAIAAEVIGTSALKASEGFTRAGPAILSIASFAVALYLVGLAMRTIPVGVVYATWSGLGIVLITTVGAVFFRQHLAWPVQAGIALIVIGVVVVNVFSGPHGA
ncbi:DMT family transporter [Enterovirga aerilata]|uniref:Multidrug efflux SMR transporter n=1 Tax=Enterovirga aerilata TaxID=2730920 RepID=A0A849I0L6_9HYPH|nr:multidrug efflux SMR transporter [Enterovirga sp. DB1703]NNM72882.1 multidrug efflux SMR transporter [Enterovirga sp. DB1703]